MECPFCKGKGDLDVLEEDTRIKKVVGEALARLEFVRAEIKRERAEKEFEYIYADFLAPIRQKIKFYDVLFFTFFGFVLGLMAFWSVGKGIQWVYSVCVGLAFGLLNIPAKPCISKTEKNLRAEFSGFKEVVDEKQITQPTN